MWCFFPSSRKAGMAFVVGGLSRSAVSGFVQAGEALHTGAALRSVCCWPYIQITWILFSYYLSGLVWLCVWVCECVYMWVYVYTCVRTRMRLFQCVFRTFCVETFRVCQWDITLILMSTGTRTNFIYSSEIFEHTAGVWIENWAGELTRGLCKSVFILLLKQDLDNTEH